MALKTLSLITRKKGDVRSPCIVIKSLLQKIMSFRMSGRGMRAGREREIYTHVKREWLVYKSLTIVRDDMFVSRCIDFIMNSLNDVQCFILNINGI